MTKEVRLKWLSKLVLVPCEGWDPASGKTTSYDRAHCQSPQRTQERKRNLVNYVLTKLPYHVFIKILIFNSVSASCSEIKLLGRTALTSFTSNYKFFNVKVEKFSLLKWQILKLTLQSIMQIIKSFKNKKNMWAFPSKVTVQNLCNDQITKLKYTTSFYFFCYTNKFLLISEYFRQGWQNICIPWYYTSNSIW